MQAAQSSTGSSRPRSSPAGLPSPGLFSAVNPAQAANKTSRITTSTILMSDEQRRRIKARSNKVGERRFARTEDKKQKVQQQMTSRAAFIESSQQSRSRQAELVTELIAKQDAMGKLERQQKEVSTLHVFRCSQLTECYNDAD
jgi:hypothetical protein